MTISFYNIQKDSIIQFNLKRIINIFVNTEIRRPFITLNVEPSDIIKKIKEKIYHKNGILLEQQKLFFNGQILEDNETFEYYNIKNESNLTIKFYNINVNQVSVFLKLTILLTIFLICS